MNNPSVEAASSRQIKNGIVISYFTIAFNIIAGLLYTPWMVRQIGQADYGLFALAVSFISFIALDFGMGTAVTRFLCQYKARGDKEGAKKLLGMVYKLFLGISALIFAVLVVAFVFIENIYVKLTPEEIAKFKVVFAISGMFTVISFTFKPLDGILVANERFIFGKLAVLFYKAGVVVLMVAALLLGYGLYSLVVVNAFVGLVVIAIKLFYIKRKTDTEIDFTCSDKIMLKEIAGFSLWTTIIIVLQSFISNISLTILGIFSGSVQIALFSVGNTIAVYTWTMSSALGDMFLPKVTRMTVADTDMQGIENLMIKVGRIELLISGMIIVGFASMGHEFMRLWMGIDFINSYYIALLLITPLIISVTQNIGGTALVALNKIRYSAIASITTAGFSIGISIFLSKIYGAVGVAAGIFIGWGILRQLIMNIIYYKVMRINIFRFFRECHFKIALPLTIMLVFGLLLQKYFPAENMLLFISKAGFFATAYFVLMWIMALNEFEKGLFVNCVKKTYHVMRRNTG